MLQTKVLFDFGMPKLIIHETETPTFEARLAIALVEKWGMVVAMSDGEDSAGRAKLRLATPEEMAERACESADKIAQELRKRKWLVEVPTYEEMEAEMERQKEAKKAQKPKE